MPIDNSLMALKRDIEQLGASIARLAHALGLTLDCTDDLSRAIRGNRVDPLGSSGLSATQVRDAHLRDELQGLLVLRYDLFMKCAERVGPAGLRQILYEVESHLVSLGFKPGDDGIDVRRLLEAQ